MKYIYIIFDPLCEEIISTHRTEKEAQDRCDQLNVRNEFKWQDSYYNKYKVES